jgi:hypothetical protein
MVATSCAGVEAAGLPVCEDLANDRRGTFSPTDYRFPPGMAYPDDRKIGTIF